VKLRHFGAEEWMLVGYLIGIFAFAIVDALSPSSDVKEWSPTEDERTLTEDHFRRLEDGDRVTFRRWHGAELALEGEVVLDASDVEVSDVDDEDVDDD
jgi:hypothetical protein